MLDAPESVLIDAAELAAALASEAPPRVLDIRYRLDRPDGRDEFRAGHIPGAVYVDMESELSRHGEPTDGRHPLPEHAQLQSAARRWGLREGDDVVVYDAWSSLGAARAWWQLSGCGVVVRVLDGGWAAWQQAGLPIETGDAAPAPGDITLQPFSLPVLDIDDAAAWPASGTLLDARAPERYRGDTEPMDPIAGHIPGAVNLPAASLLENGRMRSPAEIRAALDAVRTSEGPIAAYCGSGITAAQLALAGAIAGERIAVYPGSWSQWSNTPGRPAATGPTP